MAAKKNKASCLFLTMLLVALTHVPFPQSKAKRPPIPDKLFRRLAQHLQNAKLHKTLASLATCSKNVMEIVKPILWQEVMWSKISSKPAELFAKGRPEHFDYIRYIPTIPLISASRGIPLFVH